MLEREVGDRAVHLRWTGRTDEVGCEARARVVLSVSEALARKVERVKGRRADRGVVRLTDRDIASLRWIGEQYAMRVDQLACLLGRPATPVSDSTARGVVSRWVRAGLADYRKLIAGEPGFVWLTRTGLRHIDLPYKSWEPSAATLNHIYWVNQVRASVEKRHPGSHWRPERELRQGSGMQTFETGRHVVDAEVALDQGVVAIEVELTSKSTARRRSIMAGLATAYATVWYFAPGEVRRLLEKIRSELPSGNRVRVYPLEQVR